MQNLFVACELFKNAKRAIAGYQRRGIAVGQLFIDEFIESLFSPQQT